MTTNSVNSIVCKIKKEFPCEAISEPICAEIRKALSRGVMPIFNDIDCCCSLGERSKRCFISKEIIEMRMYALGFTKMYEEIIEPDLDEEGEWN